MGDLKSVRKMLVWGGPFSIGLFACGVWVLENNLLITVQDLWLQSAVVRITPGAPVAIYVVMISAIMAIGLVLKSIPCSYILMKIIDRGFCMVTVFGVALVAGCILVLTPLQYYAMPKLGYTRCNILQDHPSIYFTDWVKKPDWCVRGKSREWVREQARIVSQQAS